MTSRRLVASGAVLLGVLAAVVVGYRIQRHRAHADRDRQARAEGYVPYPAPPEGPPEILFVGHTYQHSGLPFRSPYPDVPAVPSDEDPIPFLRGFVAERPPARIVFGGDTVFRPDEQRLAFVADLRSDMPMIRFVLGNHDVAGDSRQPPTGPPAPVFGPPYGSEDVDGVRLIYLDTNASGPDRCLDEPQREFLATVLEPSNYRYALVFQHHRLWTGENQWGLGDESQEQALALQRDWIDTIVPQMLDGGVIAVFAGDASDTGVEIVDGLPHYRSGWAFGPDAPILWLSIELEAGGIDVSIRRLVNGSLWAPADGRGL